MEAQKRPVLPWLSVTALLFTQWACTGVMTQSVEDSAPATETLSLEAICGSDTLFMAHYSFDEQFGTPLPAECCAPGVLAADRAWLCDVDWPFSDVPSCAEWGRMAIELERLLREAPSWLGAAQRDMLHQNILKLRKNSEMRTGCIPD